MLDLNSEMGFGRITGQIGGKFKASEPSNLHIASGDTVAISPCRPPSSIISCFHIEERCDFKSIGAYVPIAFIDSLIPLRPFGRSFLEAIK